jgi:glycosyltransferase involved in cell wall biosynthesis
VPTPRRRAVDLVIWMPAINPYWARRLSGLHASGRVRFVCWFNHRRGQGREWLVAEEDLAFPHVFLPAHPVRRYLVVARLWLKARPRRMFTFHYTPTLWPALAIRLLPGRDLAFYVEKTWDTWVRRSRLKERLKSVLFSRADVVFSPGGDGEHYVRTYRPEGEVRFLPHVIDLDAFAPARSRRVPAANLRLLYLGRYVPEKGLKDLMETIDHLGEDGHVELRMVGSGPMRAELESWAAGCAVPVRVEGFIQQGDLLPVMAGADVLIFPTLGDPYGLVVSEAMAAGMTVISTSAAGEIAERLTDGPAAPRGVIVPPGDPAALASAVKRLVGDRDLVRALQAAAAAHADREFVLDRWVEAVERWCARR